MDDQIESKKKMNGKDYCRAISMVVYSISIILTISACTTYLGQMQAMGGKSLDEVPMDYWQRGLTLDVTIFVQEPMAPFLSKNDELLGLLENKMANTLTPPEGVKVTYHVIPLYAIYSGEDIEELEADRYVQITMYVSRFDDDKRGSTDQIWVQAICTLYAPGEVPDYSDFYAQRAEAQKKGLFRDPDGVTDYYRYLKQHAEHRRMLEKEQVAEGMYFSPVIMEKASILISKTGTLSSKEQKAFTDLVGNVADQMNQLVFGSNE